MAKMPQQGTAFHSMATVSRITPFGKAAQCVSTTVLQD